MSSTRSRVMAVALVLLAAAGCHKDKKPDDKAASAAQAAAPASDELRSMLSIVPITSDGVLGVDLVKLRDSGLFKAYQKDIEGLAGSQLQMIRDLCQIDPMTAASKLVAGGAGARATGDATVVIKGLAKASTMDCLKKVQAKPPEGVTVTIDGDYARLERVTKAVRVIGGDAGVPDADAGAAAGSGGVMPTIPSKQAIALQFLDDNTVVLAGRSGVAADKAAMSSILHLADKDSVTGSQGFMEMIDAIDTDAPVWFVVNGKSANVKKLGRGLLSFDAAFGHVYVGDNLDVNVTLRLENADAATRTSDLANKQLTSMRKSMMKDMIGDATVEHTDRDVRFHLVESKEQLEKLVDFAGGILGSLLESD